MGSFSKELIRRFYEVVVSGNLVDEIPQYISKDCMLRTGDDTSFIGVEGMRQHLLAVRKTYPDYSMKIIRQYEDGDVIISEFTGYDTITIECQDSHHVLDTAYKGKLYVTWSE